MNLPRLPLATYRLQFNPAFGFADALGCLEYLDELGISDLYASPIFRSRPGSSHGYDVVDPNRLNPELGGEEGFAALAREVRRRGMGWLQDIVPNHMAWHADNPMLRDVLERGPRSPHYGHFDILWDHPAGWLKGKVLAPFLGRELRQCLKKREILLTYGEDGFFLRYFETRFPLALHTWRSVLPTLATVRGLLPVDHPDLERYRGLIARLPRAHPASGGPGEEEGAGPAEEEVRAVKEELRSLYDGSEALRRRMDDTVRRVNARPGREGSALERLIARQFFMPAWWRVSLETINYRRFFTINDMIGVKVELEEVFEHTHSLVFRLVEEGAFTGLRVDHIDGLYNPGEYLSRLRRRTPGTYLVVEKILDLREELPEDWPVQGTTGYEFNNFLNGIFCQASNEGAFDQIYVDFAGMEEPFSKMLHRNKREIAENWLAGDFDNLAFLARRTMQEVEGAGLPQSALRAALVEFASLFPVYRSYAGPEGYSDLDRALVRDTLDRARLRSPEMERALQALKALLLPDEGESGLPPEGLELLMKIQQVTGPLMAKGFEDTTLYEYNRLLSLNTVGGSPAAFGLSLGEFHRFNERWSRSLPHSMNATSTHDTKRGEDVRARINVLTEIPGEWAGFLVSLRRSRGVPTGGAGSVPDANDEYLLYQTLLGAFPADGRLDEQFVERIRQYLVKATREAKRNTSWIEPNAAYEEGLLRFLDRLLGHPGGGRPADEGGTAFLRIFLPFQRKVAFYGVFNSLSQLLVKLTAPGVPDIYQGTELWDLRLVDPDNRAPVDYDERREALADVERGWRRDRGKLLRRLLENRQDGRIKLFLLHRALMTRREHPELFLHGEYLPLEVRGRHAERVIAFARRYGEGWAVTAAPRFLTAVVPEGVDPLGEEIWEDTRIELPPGAPERWRDALSGDDADWAGQAPVGGVFRRLPVGLLLGESGGAGR